MVEFMARVLGINKLLDYTASGVGAIAGPILANWKASREGKAKLTAARADAEARLIEAQSEGTSLVIIAEAQAKARQTMDATIEAEHGVVEITRGDITQSIEFQGRKRMANASSIIDGAAEELGDKEVPNHEPDPDWTARFFDYAQDISSEDMQRIWAKILAGEVESPGRTSLRTLDTLRNMTKRDAEMFSDLCPFIMGDGFVFYDDSVKNFGPFGLSNLLHLVDCNFLNFERNLQAIRQWGEENYIVLDYQNGALRVTSNSRPSGTLGIPIVRLTSSGRELGGLTPQTVNMDYLRAFSKFLKSKDCRLDYLDSVVPLDDGRLWAPRSIAIEPEPERVDGATP